MFRVVGQPISFRHRVRELIYKMLFLWSKEPEPSPPRGNPWVAWLTTAIVIWGCRRRIFKAIIALSPLRLLKNFNIRKLISITKTQTSISTNSMTRESNEREKVNLVLHPKQHVTEIKTKLKRLATGDGPHVSNCSNVIQTTQQVQYRMTRSGRIYGRYPNKIAAAM